MTSVGAVVRVHDCAAAGGLAHPPGLAPHVSSRGTLSRHPFILTKASMSLELPLRSARHAAKLASPVAYLSMSASGRRSRWHLVHHPVCLTRGGFIRQKDVQGGMS
jgi:hypothetical protein